MINSQPKRSQLAARATMRLAIGFILLIAMLLLPAGTWAYLEAWAYVTVLFIPMAFVLVYLLSNDPDLLERRLRLKEKQAEQDLIIRLGAVCCFFGFLLPGFDRRFGWSHVPVAAVVLADVCVLLGYGLFIVVLRENRYASRIVEVEPGQRVITTGPYAMVRHPMYLGVIAMGLSTPVALGSWWALIPWLLMVAVLIARIRREEQLLAQELEGYPEYMRATRYRLIPGIW